jgi:16S rRNA (uracil1498-N3)-methyltransferase
MLWNYLQPSGKVTILIGPEGDFTPEELMDASSAGFVPVSLGPSRYRTETAGIVACQSVKMYEVISKIIIKPSPEQNGDHQRGRVI